MLDSLDHKKQPVYKQEENYSGEHAIQHEVLQAQLEFYKKGEVVSRIRIGVFIAACVILAVLCLLALLAPLYWSEFLQLLRSMFFPVYY